jgi:hypothetical protein
MSSTDDLTADDANSVVIASGDLVAAVCRLSRRDFPRPNIGDCSSSVRVSSSVRTLLLLTLLQVYTICATSIEIVV